MKQRTILLQDEFLVLWGLFLTETRDENIRSCLYSYTGLWLVGVIANFILGRILEKLVLTHPVTEIQNNLVSRDFVVIGRVIVKAVISQPFVLEHPEEARPVFRHVQFGINGLQEPLEVLTLELGTELPPLCHVPKRLQAGVGVSMVVDLFKFIHPHFSCTDTVGQSLFAGVRSLLGENVANVRTWVYLQGPTALPDLIS